MLFRMEQYLEFYTHSYIPHSVIVYCQILASLWNVGMGVWTGIEFQILFYFEWHLVSVLFSSLHFCVFIFVSCNDNEFSSAYFFLEPKFKALICKFFKVEPCTIKSTTYKRCYVHVLVVMDPPLGLTIFYMIWFCVFVFTTVY